MDRAERRRLASKRLQNVLASQTIANARTLENKISDAGPLNQRIEPHVLTSARQVLEKQGKIRRVGSKTAWFYLDGTPESEWAPRLDELSAIHDQLGTQSFTTRLGQSLEIAIYKALAETGKFEFLECTSARAVVAGWGGYRENTQSART